MQFCKIAIVSAYSFFIYLEVIGKVNDKDFVVESYVNSACIPKRDLL